MTDEDFYASEYWQTGQGLYLWQMRLFNAVLGEVNRDAHFHWFITNIDLEESNPGIIASISAPHFDATIEIENQTLYMSLSTRRRDENGKLIISDRLNFLFGDPTDTINLPWYTLNMKLIEFRFELNQQKKPMPSGAISHLETLIRSLLEKEKNQNYEGGKLPEI